MMQLCQIEIAWFGAALVGLNLFALFINSRWNNGSLLKHPISRFTTKTLLTTAVVTIGLILIWPGCFMDIISSFLFWYEVIPPKVIKWGKPGLSVMVMNAVGYALIMAAVCIWYFGIRKIHGSRGHRLVWGVAMGGACMLFLRSGWWGCMCRQSVMTMQCIAMISGIMFLRFLVGFIKKEHPWKLAFYGPMALVLPFLTYAAINFWSPH